MNSSPTEATSLAQVILKRRRAQPFFNRHPWVFAGAIERITGEPQPGDEVDLYSHSGELIARGLVNSQSNIVVRLYSWEASVRLDDTFWSARMDEAIALRQRLFGPKLQNRACRMIFSEADGLSGLIVDSYAGWLIVQFTSLAVAQRRERIVDFLNRKLQPRGIWLRTEKGIREAEGLDIEDGLVFGDVPPRPLFIEENGVQYGVDIVEGQKTGFFLDQRENRAATVKYVEGRRVLDLFCYTGGFGLSALVSGHAKSLVGIDVSETALAMARANAQLNGVAAHCSFEHGDAFDRLEHFLATGKSFDTVVLDPPKLARNRAGVSRAMKAYERLNRMAIELLPRDGILVTCSCSGHVTRDLFEEMLSRATTTANRRLQILEARGQAADHPVSIHCRESNYLKCYIGRVI